MDRLARSVRREVVEVRLGILAWVVEVEVEGG